MRDAKTAILLGLVSWSCGGKHPEDTKPRHPEPPPAPPAVTCQAAIHHALGLTHEVPPEVMAKLEPVVAADCTSQQWAQSVVDCFNTAQTDPDTEKCAQTLSEPQQKHLKDVVEKLFAESPPDGMKKKKREEAVSIDHPPEWFAPAWTKVGVGQKVSFSTAAIDQDLDETAVTVTRLPASARFDALTQTITWTPAKADMPKAEFELAIDQPGRGIHMAKSFSIEVVAKAQPAVVAATQSATIETLLMIRDPKRLAQVNKDWPLEKLLEVGADGFKLQSPEERRKQITSHLDGKTSYQQLLAQLALTHDNPRLDPKSDKFDKAAFGDSKSWKIVAFRPRIDRQWTELRVVYQAMNAAEPVFAMFRLRPVVEYVPALPRPDEERIANNKQFLGLVAKHLMKDGAPNPKLEKDVTAHGKAVSALMTELMTYDDTKTKPYLHGFMIGIAAEARMGGGSARNGDGTYKSGDGWAWSALKPFQTADLDKQAYVNVSIPGFWTQTVPSPDNKTWIAKCAPKFNADDPKHVAGYEVLCRKTMGLVDLPADRDGKPINGKIDANNLYVSHKLNDAVELLPLEDGRRDNGEENGMTCSQCHIRNFGMHDWHDKAPVDPSAGMPKAMNHALGTLNFQIIPSASGRWEEFTLEFLKHQECRAAQNFADYAGGSKLGCPLLDK